MEFTLTETLPKFSKLTTRQKFKDKVANGEKGIRLKFYNGIPKICSNTVISICFLFHNIIRERGGPPFFRISGLNIKANFVIILLKSRKCIKINAPLRINYMGYISNG